jgi:hypothetical protein
MSEPLLSIITALKGSDPLLFKTAESLLPQLGPMVEWIIKNSDESCSADLLDLEKDNKYVRIYGIPDKSIYEGLNQGLRKSTGIRFCVNGAGDVFEKNAIADILTAIRNTQTDAAIFFPIWYDDPPTGVIIPKPEELPLRMAVPNPGAILSRRMAIDLGGFDTTYKIAADYDLLCRYMNSLPESQVYQTPICRFLPGGMSERRRSEGFFEKQLIRVRVWGYKPDFIK